MSFEWPMFLFSLALLPLLLLLYLAAQRRRRTYAVRFTNLALLREVAGPRPGLRRHIPPLLYLLGFTALLISLARPNAVIAVPRNQAAMMLVLDVSGSMNADDMQPNRMLAAKQAAEQFVEALPDDAQVGLVSFNTSAAVNAAPTRDHQAVLQAIRGLQAGGGTAIGEGLHLALDQLQQRTTAEDGAPTPGMVVLLSDGESMIGRNPNEAAQRASDEQVPVFTVGVGQRGVTTQMGDQWVRLDEATLQSIAEETSGQYFYASDAGELSQIYSQLGAQVTLVEERTEITALLGALGTLLFLGGGLLGLRWFQQFP